MAFKFLCSFQRITHSTSPVESLQALLAVEGFDFSNARSRHRTLLNSGSLVSIRSTGRSLTSKGDRTEEVALKLTDGDVKNMRQTVSLCRLTLYIYIYIYFFFIKKYFFFKELLISGNKMRLRALTSGELLGLVKTDPLNYELRLQPTWSEEAATFFSPLLVHEEIYRSASRFAQFVHMGSGLEVVELRVSKRRGQSLKDWDSSGWRIFAINGKTPSREEVDEILQKGKGSKMVKAQSSVSDPHSAAPREDVFLTRGPRQGPRQMEPFFFPALVVQRPSRSLKLKK